MTVVSLALAVTAIVLGGYGLYKVAYAQGYICGRESMRKGVRFTLDDEEGND